MLHLNENVDWENKAEKRPDIILKTSSDDILYIDAKYKTDSNKNHDYNQIITYLTQRGLNSALKYGELIYPLVDENQEDKLIVDRQRVKIRYIDLSRAKDTKYLKQFVKETIINYENNHGN